jgi:hypothetical protein
VYDVLASLNCDAGPVAGEADRWGRRAHVGHSKEQSACRGQGTRGTARSGSRCSFTWTVLQAQLLDTSPGRAGRWRRRPRSRGLRYERLISAYNALGHSFIHSILLGFSRAICSYARMQRFSRLPTLCQMNQQAPLHYTNSVASCPLALA